MASDSYKFFIYLVFYFFSLNQGYNSYNKIILSYKLYDCILTYQELNMPSLVCAGLDL